MAGDAVPIPVRCPDTDSVRCTSSVYRVGVWGVIAMALASSALAEPAARPYEPPPFTRFPDEPDVLPPVTIASKPPAWRTAVRAGRIAMRAGYAALREMHVRVLAKVDAPIDLAGGLEVVFPWRVGIGASFGFLPRNVGRAGNDALVEQGVYAPEVGSVVGASMDRIVVWRVHAAVRPWAGHGLVVGVGYGQARLSGQSRADQVAAAVGVPIPEELDIGDVRFQLESRASLVDAELGWEWRWRDDWVFGVSVGAVFTTKSRTRVTSDRPTDEIFVDVAASAAQKLDSAYDEYGKAPFVSSFIGYEL